MINSLIIPVVVIYHPNEKQLESLIFSLLKNFPKLIVVWNGPHPYNLPNCINNSKVILIDMKENAGLAIGLNRGIQRAFDLGAKWVYLSDQDSILPLNFKNLAIKYSQCIPSSLKVGSLGPSFYNAITKKEGSIFKIRFLQFKRHKPNVNEFYSETDYLITSGTFISKLVLNDVGFFDDKLFIDLIDTEWCLRAKHKGYHNFVLPRLKLHHNLGEYGLSFFGEIYPIHPPLRMYYYFRNSIYLYKKKSISLNWKIVDCFRNIFRFLFYIVLVKPRLEYVKMSTLGIYHGIINRMGECKR